MPDRAASLARIAHWLAQQEEDYLAPPAVEPPPPPRLWYALSWTFVGLLVAIGLLALTCINAPDRYRNLVRALSVLQLLWVLVAWGHDYRAMKRYRAAE